MKIQNKVVLITGAAKRIGRCIATTLHQHGMNIIIHYRDSNIEALQLQDELNQRRKDSAFAVHADLNSLEDIKKLAKESINHWGRLDALINNASTFLKTFLGNVSEEQFDLLMQSNFKAPFFLSQECQEELKKQKGNIINITDIHSAKPQKNYSVYSSAKAALAIMTKSLANELAPNVRVNAVAPGAIVWPEGQNELDEKIQDKILQQILLKRPGNPQDIADTVLFLLTQNYITGQTIAVDGGRSINYVDVF